MRIGSVILWGITLLMYMVLVSAQDPESSSPKTFVTSITMCAAQLSKMNNKYSRRANLYKLPTRPEIRQRFTSQAGSPCPNTGRLFRTADGFCNNIRRPSLGQSFERFKRFVRSNYNDRKGSPRIFGRCRRVGRRWCSRRLLPSARTVSTVVHPEVKTQSIGTVMRMQWGQFLDHDFTAAAVEQPESPRTCCDQAASDSTIFRGTDDCFPIQIPQTPVPDRFFTQTCLELVRSRAIDVNFTRRNPREQQNLLTAFVDASNVYGSDQETQDRLRGVNGRMKTSAGDLLPRGRDEDCIRGPNAPFCFDAGDERVHVFPGLTALHTLFVRIHNYIVEDLTQHNAKWNGERLFQETRKIISAIMQRITYLEFVPEVLSESTIKKFDLDEGNFKYDITRDPSIANVFATAVFRYGHSLIPNFLVIDGKQVLSRQLFNNPEFIFTSLTSLVENLVSNPAELRDRFLTEEITDHLFETAAGSFDLAAFNIQRGRDHGLPPYNWFRRFCRLPRVTSFSSPVFGNGGPFLAKVYEHVNDIDVFAGGMVELSEPGSTLGPLFSCLMARQFRDLKFGDSFWYETRDRRRGFSAAQRRSIGRVTLSQLVCQGGFGLKSVQRNPFKVVRAGNLKVDCSRFPKIDLSPWYEH
ncbi:eosinophil peroxidase [Patella vulgata]|uniref:eosinophil peroxidase n=1 Tax=Patella vulgata TaxID=6465 RepID=UPI00217FB955|nr:eosinophil peroxidase [Patella vulgata]